MSFFETYVAKIHQSVNLPHPALQIGRVFLQNTANGEI